MENIRRNRLSGKPLTVAILDGAHQVAVPALAATLTICIVFFPVLMLEGPARYLFVSLAIGVVFSMIASYLLSRTLVPTLARRLPSSEQHGGQGKNGRVERFNEWRDRQFDRLRDMHGSALAICIGTRIEDTEAIVAQVQEEIRRIIPADELDMLNDMIGLPTFYNLAFVSTDNVGDQDAEVLIQLKKKHHPSQQYMARIRRALPTKFPCVQTYFMPADVVTQVLNFGVSAMIDVQIEGKDVDASFEIARDLDTKMRQVPGTEDVRIAQVFNHPALLL